MKRLTFVFALLLAAGCSSNSNDPNANYMSCFTDEFGDAFVRIEIPFNRGGLLTRVGEPLENLGVGWHYEGRTVAFGQLPAGEHEFELRIEHLDDGTDEAGDIRPEPIVVVCTLTVPESEGGTRDGANPNGGIGDGEDPGDGGMDTDDGPAGEDDDDDDGSTGDDDDDDSSTGDDDDDEGGGSGPPLSGDDDDDDDGGGSGPPLSGDDDDDDDDGGGSGDGPPAGDDDDDGDSNAFEFQCLFNEIDRVVTLDLQFESGEYQLLFDDMVFRVDEPESISFDLDPGSYEFRLYRVAGDGSIELVDTCEVLVPEISADGETPVESYVAHSVSGALSPPVYGLRLDGFFDGNRRSEVIFHFNCVLFDIFEDGSARLHGHIQIVGAEANGFPDPVLENVDREWYLDVAFDPSTGDNADFRYFRIAAHGRELRNIHDADDSADLVSYGPSFQVGTGANEKNSEFGASGWLNYAHQPGDDLDTHRDASDFLMNLQPKDFDAVVLHRGSSKVITTPSKMGPWILAGWTPHKDVADDRSAP